MRFTICLNLNLFCSLKCGIFFPSPPVLPLATGRNHYKGCKGLDSHSQGSFLWVQGMDIYTFTLYLSSRQLRFEAMIPNLPASSSSLPLPAALPSVPALGWHPQLHDTPVTEQAVERLTCYFSLFICVPLLPRLTNFEGISDSEIGKMKTFSSFLCQTNHVCFLVSL